MSYFGTIYADTELPSRARVVYMYTNSIVGGTNVQCTTADSTVNG